MKNNQIIKTVSKSFIALFLLLALIAGTNAHAKNRFQLLERYEVNLKVLQGPEILDPAIITCSSGVDGRCYEPVTAWPIKKCVWTGRQSDVCWY